jgi:hypothetical protein
MRGQQTPKRRREAKPTFDIGMGQRGQQRSKAGIASLLLLKLPIGQFPDPEWENW